MRKAKPVRVLVAVFVVALAAQAAWADLLLDYFATYGPTGVPDAGQTISLPQFDQATLGTLLSVTLTLEATASAGSIDWDNESAVATDVTLGIGGEVTAAAPSALTLVVVPLQQGTQLGVAVDSDVGPDFAGDDWFGVTGGTGTDSDTDIITTAGLFTPYIGTGTFNVNISSVVETLISTTGGSGASQHTPGNTEGTVTVTYTYVPEPGTLALMALGSVVLLRRRRKG